MRIAVLGGGISGLSAAWESTSDPTHHVEVLDAAPRFGGSIRTTPFAGRLVDEGADAFLRRVPEGLGLAEELALTDRLTSPAARHAFVWSGGALRPLPTGTVLGVPVDADAVARAGMLSDNAIERIRAEPTLGGAPLDADESVGSLIRRRFGDEVLEQLVEPLLGGINAGEADEMSVDAVAPQIAEAARRSTSLSVGLRDALPVATTGEAPPIFVAPRDGMGAIIDELVAGLAARGVELRSAERAVVVEPHDAGWRIGTEAGSVIEVDAVVVALPAGPAALLLAPLAPIAAEHLGSIETASVVIVTLAYPLDELAAPLDGSGFLVPRDAGLTITAASFASSKWAHLDGAGTAILRVSCGHHRDPGPIDVDDAALIELVGRDLELTLGIDVAPTEVRASRHRGGLPQYAVGHLDRVAVIEADLRANAEGLAITGASLRGVGVPACIRQGRAVARAVTGRGAQR